MSRREGVSELTEAVATVVAADKVRPGDMLLLARLPDEPIGRLIRDLDGTQFSHCGLALDGGVMASAQFGPLSRTVSDLGGVRRDTFASLWSTGRSIYRVPVEDADRRRRAVAFVEALPAPSGIASRFAFAKLFLVAAALHAVHPGSELAPEARRALVVAATDAATEWIFDADRPRFYCAELVAAALGLSFHLTDLLPPEAGPDLGRVFADLPATPLRVPDHATLPRLVRALVEHDPEFLRLAGRTTAASIGYFRGPRRWRPAAFEDVSPGPLTPRTVPTGGPPLPGALTTPRMLWEALGGGVAARVTRDGPQRRLSPGDT